MEPGRQSLVRHRRGTCPGQPGRRPRLVRGRRWIRGWYRTPEFDLFHTRDGGKSWQEEDLSKRYLISLTRLGGGAWLAQVRLGRNLVRWNGKRFLPDKMLDSRIDETWTDSTGGLVVTLENGDLWALDAAGKSWTRLR